MSLGLAASGTAGPLRAWRKPALQQIFESGDSLRLQFPREDLGFTYTAPGCAVLPDGRMAESEWSPPKLHDGTGALATRLNLTGLCRQWSLSSPGRCCFQSSMSTLVVCRSPCKYRCSAMGSRGHSHPASSWQR